MSNFQLASLAALAAALAYQFLPKISFPVSKTTAMRQIEQVIAIRDSAKTPEVKTACQTLLQALLQ